MHQPGQSQGRLIHYLELRLSATRQLFGLMLALQFPPPRLYGGPLPGVELQFICSASNS